MISLTTYLRVELLGAALLAFWAVVRFPRRGPKSLVAALGLVVAALAVLQLTPVGVSVVAKLPFGLYAALLCLVLPVLFSTFLTAGWLLRSLLGMAGGSGGGGTGHRVRA